VTALVFALLAGTATWLVLAGRRDRRRYSRCDEGRRQEALLRILAARPPRPTTAADSGERPRPGTSWYSTDPGVELRIAAHPPRARCQAGGGLKPPLTKRHSHPVRALAAAEPIPCPAGAKRAVRPGRRGNNGARAGVLRPVPRT